MHGQEAEEVDEIPQSRIPVALLMAAGGLVAVLYGADLLVDGAIGIARGFGLSEAVIGLTIVAIGTSPAGTGHGRGRRLAAPCRCRLRQYRG